MPPAAQHVRPSSLATNRQAAKTVATAQSPATAERVSTPRKKTPSKSQVYQDRPQVFVKYHRRPLDDAHNGDGTGEANDKGPDDFVQQDADGVALIAPTGDLVLQVRQDADSEQSSYRVRLAVLRTTSPYFERLLGHNFKEGLQVEKLLAQVTLEHGSADTAPTASLPHVAVEHVGQISRKVKSIHPLTTDFLAILHGRDTTGRKVPLPNLANLCVVADRFDCLAPISKWAHSKGVLRPTASSQTLPSEETQRQKAYIGLLLDYGPWLTRHTAQLVLIGSQRWKSDDTTALASSDSDPPWLDLPRCVEDELYFRRTSILETIAALVGHYLKVYASPTRQCKLGYDSSAQCDAFQLGQYVKFLAKKNLFAFGASFAAASDTPLHEVGSILALVQTLREMPAYQVDPHHAHCGPRKRLAANLDIVEELLHESSIGVCAECMQQQSLSSSSSSAAAAGWSWQDARPAAQVAVRSLGRGGRFRGGAADDGDQHWRHQAGGTSGGGGWRHRGSSLFVANAWLWADDDWSAAGAGAES